MNSASDETIQNALKPTMMSLFLFSSLCRFLHSVFLPFSVYFVSFCISFLPCFLASLLPCFLASLLPSFFSFSLARFSLLPSPFSLLPSPFSPLPLPLSLSLADRAEPCWQTLINLKAHDPPKAAKATAEGTKGVPQKGGGGKGKSISAAWPDKPWRSCSRSPLFAISPPLPFISLHPEGLRPLKADV